MVFNDGSAKWELIKISNAEQLNGLTAKQILAKTSKVSIISGTISNGGIIPVPSGYERSQCKYAVWMHNEYNCTFDNYTTTYIYIIFRVSVDQSTGRVTCYEHTGDRKQKGIIADYLCIAVK